MKTELKTPVGTVKAGTPIHIIKMYDDNGRDKQASEYNGRRGKVTFIDDSGLIHGDWGGLALISELDEFVIESQEQPDLKSFKVTINCRGAVPALDRERAITIKAHTVIEAKKIAVKSCDSDEVVHEVTEQTA